MAKRIFDLEVIENYKISPMYSHIILGLSNNCCSGNQDVDCSNVDLDYDSILKSVKPGQFMQIKIDSSKETFLRRPISINYVDIEKSHIHMLVRNAGDGTKSLCDINKGARLNVILPLGNGFSVDKAQKHPLLVGGGVGVAPLLYLGKVLADNGVQPTFLLAANKSENLLQLEDFKKYGNVVVSTDDGSLGHHGLVTENPVLQQTWDMIYCCGPMPMMKGVAKIAKAHGIGCEVSLENTMACGLGACLCCVEDTVDGHVCVCTDGPVFDIETLKW